MVNAQSAEALSKSQGKATKRGNYTKGKEERRVGLGPPTEATDGGPRPTLLNFAKGWAVFQSPVLESRARGLVKAGLFLLVPA